MEVQGAGVDSEVGESIYNQLTCDERLHLVQVQSAGVHGEVGEFIYNQLTCDERLHLVQVQGAGVNGEVGEAGTEASHRGQQGGRQNVVLTLEWGWTACILQIT